MFAHVTHKNISMQMNASPMVYLEMKENLFY